MIVTYSPSYTLVPTYECFNLCSYCNFRRDIGSSGWLSREEARKRLERLEGVTEILILSGEVHPLSPMREAWFQHIYHLCELAVSLNYFPHTNVGPLSWEEMSTLKEVNASMGLMLEQMTDLDVHHRAPSKIPQLRLEQLNRAGELQIPFTTGILLGIGENEQDWWDSLEAIAQVQKRWGHIQEVILQPYSPGERETFVSHGFHPHKLPSVIAKAREILPDTITIQIPPNLLRDSYWLLECLCAGARDLGGINPIDEVNPDYPHWDYPTLKRLLASQGWQLTPRLPVYPQYYGWLPSIFGEI